MKKFLKWLGWIFGLVSSGVLAYYYLRKQEIPAIDELENGHRARSEALQDTLEAINEELDENIKEVKREKNVSNLIARFKRNRDTLGDH